MPAKSQERLPAGWAVQFKAEKNGRRIKCYVNFRTGQKFFSKEDLLRYIKMKKTRLHEPQPTSGCGKRHSKNISTKLVAKEKDRENGHGKRHSESSRMEPVREGKNCPEWLPHGWVVDLKTRKSGSAIGQQYKVYIEPLTGRKFFSKPEVLRHLESIKHKNVACKRKTVRIGMNAANKVVVEKSTVADLPPGWIKETKIKMTARGVRKDPYYMDPLSGYVFRSKKDVFRYLETGEISKHAFKPTKRDTDDPWSINEEALPSPAVKRQKLEHPGTRRQLFPVKESSDGCSPALLEAEVLKKRRAKGVSAETVLAGASMAEISPEKMAKMTIEEDAETTKKTGLSCSALPMLEGSKRSQGTNVFADNRSVATPVIDSLQGQRFLETQIECSNQNSLDNLTKSEKKKKLNLPRRSSKRLAGLEPELVVNGVPIERAPKHVATESCKSKASPAAGLTSSGLVEEISQQLKAGSVMELANCMSSEVNIPLSGGSSNKIKSFSGEKLQKLKSAETVDGISEHVSLIFGESYLDPCLESAFKALMGESPMNSNPDSGPVSTPAADILQEKNLQTTKLEKRNSRKTRINSMQSKNKQELNLPRRSSNRLAGLEPEMVANWVSIERVPRKVNTESCKSKAIEAAGLNSSILVDEASQQLKAGPLMEPADCVLSGENISSGSEPSNKIKPLGNLAIPSEQSAEINDNKSEPLVSSPSTDSHLDPCKAVMGKTMMEGIPDHGLVSFTAADILLGNNSQVTKVESSSNKKTLINSVKSKNKQVLNVPRRSSKRLAGLEPELGANSLSSERASGNATIESCKSEVFTHASVDPHDQADNATQQLETGHETTPAHHDGTDMGTPLHEGSSNKSSKPLATQTVSEEQSQKFENEKAEEHPLKLENERIECENPDSQLLFPFGDSWSDPCLEFAFKTLTGAIPVEDNLVIQDYFLHQLDPSHTQREDSLALPDFGSINSFQTNVSFQFDAPEKQPPSELQLPANPSPPPGNVSIPSCSTIASQPPCFEGNKEFDGKVKS